MLITKVLKNRNLLIPTSDVFHVKIISGFFVVVGFIHFYSFNFKIRNDFDYWRIELLNSINLYIGLI